jgi:hypothetical protein
MMRFVKRLGRKRRLECQRLESELGYVPHFEKGGLGGILVFEPLKSPSIPLFQSVRQEKASNLSLAGVFIA